LFAPSDNHEHGTLHRLLAEFRDAVRARTEDPPDSDAPDPDRVLARLIDTFVEHGEEEEREVFAPLQDLIPEGSRRVVELREQHGQMYNLLTNI
jgi:hypothetical protein